MRALFRKLDGHHDDPLPPAEHATAHYEALRLFEDPAEMYLAWKQLKQRTSRWRAWMDVMLLVMNKYPEKTGLMLEGLHEPIGPPVWGVADVFTFLVRWSTEQRQQESQLPRLLLFLLQNSARKRYQFPQWTIGTTVSLCEPDAAARLYAALLKYGHPLHLNTKLKIAGRLAGVTKYKLPVLRILEDVVANDPGIEMGDRRVAALSTALLTLPAEWKERRGSPTDVNVVTEAFDRIVRLDFRQNLVTYTAMIKALCEANRLEIAWRVYDVLRDQGIQPDAVLISTLLNGSTSMASLESVTRLVRETELKVLRQPAIGKGVVYAVLLAVTNEAVYAKPAGTKVVQLPAFYPTLQVYARLFDLAPLQTLIPIDLQSVLDGTEPTIPPPAPVSEEEGEQGWAWQRKLPNLLDALPPTSPKHLIEPSNATLGLMVSGYLKTVTASGPVMALFTHFRTLVKNRDPVAIEVLSSGSLLYDAVLTVLALHPDMLPTVVDIINTMIEEAAGSVETLVEDDVGSADVMTEEVGGSSADAQEDVSNEQDVPYEQDLPNDNETNNTPHEADVSSAATVAPTPVFHPPPSVKTWTTLLRAFARYRGPSEAARVISAMRQHGVEPNDITWTTLLLGYARSQRTSEVMAVLNEFDKAGWAPGAYLVRAVSRLQNPQPVLERLEERSAMREDDRWREIHE
ncbi:hypothetical protein B0J18DRAFT_353123, partial [Chaetomium sp. MPI-SDFR-AT-0129]